jgi:hypothetical protein
MRFESQAVVTVVLVSRNANRQQPGLLLRQRPVHQVDGNRPFPHR